MERNGLKGLLEWGIKGFAAVSDLMDLERIMISAKALRHIPSLNGRAGFPE